MSGAGTKRRTWLPEVFTPLDSMSATETQSSPLNPGPPSTTFELDCGYHLRVLGIS